MEAGVGAEEVGGRQGRRRAQEGRPLGQGRAGLGGQGPTGEVLGNAVRVLHFGTL